MNVHIRFAKPSDWQVIQKLNDEVMKDNAQYDPHLKTNYAYSKIGEKYYKDIVSNQEFCCFIAELDSIPVGYLVAEDMSLDYKCDYKTRPIAEIYDMGVTSKYRSQGVGSQLIADFKNWCKEKGIELWRVNVYVQNERARKFYEKHGLKPLDISFEGEV
ncbi:GNAT family N-acetyltransferase [Candidatus Beckwithbacteria bacterium]|nr:GNAT family N-acetyltransferase [Candidatus Beckwithbacteria bacterium]